MSIRTASTLHTIIEAVDATKQPTALSHHWSFIMKLIGRHCSSLMMVAGIGSEDDCNEWKEKLSRVRVTVLGFDGLD